MITLISLVAQTKTGAIVEIIILLLIAGLIAYLTAYYYYKPIYLKKIALLEDEKDSLNKKVNSLDAEISQLENKIIKMEKEAKEKNKPK
jgi:uncharacterized protein YlxW (UPF0749 family)